MFDWCIRCKKVCFMYIIIHSIPWQIWGCSLSQMSANFVLFFLSLLHLLHKPGHPGVQRWGVCRELAALPHHSRQQEGAGSGPGHAGPCWEGQRRHAGHSPLRESPNQIRSFLFWKVVLKLFCLLSRLQLVTPLSKRCLSLAPIKGWSCPSSTRPPPGATLMRSYEW